MPNFREYQTVRVVRVLDASRPFDGTRGVARPPAVGDEGIVREYVDNVQSYPVESFDLRGRTIWIASFDPEELESVEEDSADREQAG